MPIAEVRVPIKLDRDRILIFDANYMAAFEEATGKPYHDVVHGMFTVLQEERDKAGFAVDDKGRVSGADYFELLIRTIQRVKMADLSALVWAACIEYDRADNPTWPLTLATVRRHLLPKNSARVLNHIFEGHNANSPTAKELGEASAGSGKILEMKSEAQPSDSESSGLPSTDLLADAFA